LYFVESNAVTTFEEQLHGKCAVDQLRDGGQIGSVGETKFHFFSIAKAQGTDTHTAAYDIEGESEG